MNKMFPVTEDITQQCGKILEVPEIRVWCHPQRIGKPKDDYYYTFETFTDAMNFIKEHKESEDVPLIAFRGYEINLFELKKPPKRAKG